MYNQSDPPPVIDPLSDELLSDSKVAKLLKVSPISIWRLRTKGKRGVKLPAIPYGRGAVTTREAIRWFFAELQRRDQEPREHQQRRRRTVDPALIAECERAGI